MHYEKCLHPNNKGYKVRKISHRKEYFVQTGDLAPHELNKNNDCKWFEPRKQIRRNKSTTKFWLVVAVVAILLVLFR